VKKTIIAIIAAFLCLSCGDSKEDINSRNEMSSITRQINTLYRDFNDNKSAEEQLVLIRVRDYYSEYTKQFRNLRQKLAAATITPQFEPIRSLSDSLISQSVDFINRRQAIMIKLFEVSNNLSRFKDHTRSSKEYEFRPSGRQLYSEYLIKALEERKDFVINRFSLEFMFLNDVALCHRMMLYADSLNQIALKMKFVDTLSFGTIALDTTDFLHIGWKGVRDVELPMPKFRPS
jgi:hypothetical protein